VPQWTERSPPGSYISCFFSVFFLIFSVAYPFLPDGSFLTFPAPKTPGQLLLQTFNFPQNAPRHLDTCLFSATRTPESKYLPRHCFTPSTYACCLRNCPFIPDSDGLRLLDPSMLAGKIFRYPFILPEILKEVRFAFATSCHASKTFAFPSRDFSAPFWHSAPLSPEIERVPSSRPRHPSFSQSCVQTLTSRLDSSSAFLTAVLNYLCFRTRTRIRLSGFFLCCRCSVSPNTDSVFSIPDLEHF